MCVLFSTTLALVSAAVNEKYYERWPIQGDTASYWSKDLELYAKTIGNDFRSNVFNEALANLRDPLRTAALAVLPPETALSINGHLYFTAFAALLFFFTLTYATARRCGSMRYGLVPPLVFLCLLGIYHPMYGAPSKLPDFPAALFLGAAQFALYLGVSQKSLTWVCGSGLLLAAASLTRFHAWIYGSFLLAPMILCFALKSYFDGNRSIVRLFLPVMAFGVPFAALAGWFVLGSMVRNFDFYASAGYALNSSTGAVLSTTGIKMLSHVFGIPALIVLLLVTSGYAATRWSANAKIDLFDLGVVSWGAVSILLLVLVILRVEDDFTQMYYAVPGIIFLGAAPFKFGGGAQICFPAFNRFSTALVIVLPILIAAMLSLHLRSEDFLYPRPKDAALKDFETRLSELLAASFFRQNDAATVPVVDSNFDYYARYMVPAVWQRFQRASIFGNAFQIRQSQWQLAYGSKDQDVSGRVQAALERNVDLFAALQETSFPASVDVFKDEYTRKIATEINSFISASPQVWEVRGSATGPLGDVVVYRNKNRQDILAEAQKAIQAIHEIVAGRNPEGCQGPILFFFWLPDQVLNRWKNKLHLQDSREIFTAPNDNAISHYEKIEVELRRLQRKSGLIVALNDPRAAQADLTLPMAAEKSLALRVLEDLRSPNNQSWSMLGTADSPWGRLSVFQAQPGHKPGFMSVLYEDLCDHSRKTLGVAFKLWKSIFGSVR